MDKSKALKNLGNRRKMFEDYLRQVKNKAKKPVLTKKELYR